MSKFALRALVKAVRAELREDRVSVGLVSPGYVESAIRDTDNWGRVHEAARDTVPSWLVTPAEQAGRQIVRVVERRTHEGIATVRGKAIVALGRYARGLVCWAFSRLPRRPVRSSSAGAGCSLPPKG